jgi:hypothetical protein
MFYKGHASFIRMAFELIFTSLPVSFARDFTHAVNSIKTIFIGKSILSNSCL